MFSSKSSIVSCLTMRTLIHFEFIFVCGVRKCSNFIFLYITVQFLGFPGSSDSNVSVRLTRDSCESSVQFSSVQSLSHVRLFVTPWITARQASLSITNSRSLLRLMPIKSVMPSSHLILCGPLLLLPPIPPSIRLFSNESTLHMRWPNIGVSASASVLLMNTQDWFPLGWTGWISLQSKGLSRVFSNSTVQNYQFLFSQLSSQSNSHIHTWPLEKP